MSVYRTSWHTWALNTARLRRGPTVLVQSRKKHPFFYAQGARAEPAPPHHAGRGAGRGARPADGRPDLARTAAGAARRAGPPAREEPAADPAVPPGGSDAGRGGAGAGLEPGPAARAAAARPR